MKLLSNSGQKDQASTRNEDGFMTAASSSEDKLTEEEPEQRSPTIIKLFSPDLQNILGTHILKIGVNPKHPVDISGGRHTVFVYCDLIQDQILGNKLTSLLRTIALPNNSAQKTKNAIFCHQSFSNLQWKNVVNSSFQSISIRYAAKDSLKKSVSKTISESTTADRSRPPPPKRLQSTHASGGRGPRVTATSARQAAGRSLNQNPLSGNKLEIREIPSRKRPAKTTLKTTKTKCSRSDIWSNVRF